MGERALAWRKQQLAFSLPLLVAVLLSIAAWLPSPAADKNSDTSSALTTLEQKLFFKTYTDETPESRLVRIEKRIFGDTMPGNFDERLKRVSTASSPQLNPDGSLSGSTPQVKQGTTNGATSPPPATGAEEDERAAIERARVALQAAREEEVSQLMAEGVGLWRAKRGPEALQRFEQVIKLAPNNPEAHYSAGIVYESNGNLIEAMADYKKAADLNPENHEYIEAVQAVQKKIASQPKTDPRQAELSRLAISAAAAYKRGEYLSAIDLYKQLDAKAPNQALVKYNLGTLYLQAKDPFTALEYYKQSVALKPNEARYVQAYQQLQQALPMSPTAEPNQANPIPAQTQIPPSGFLPAQRSGMPSELTTTLPPANLPQPPPSPGQNGSPSKPNSKPKSVPGPAKAPLKNSSAIQPRPTTKLPADAAALPQAPANNRFNTLSAPPPDAAASYGIIAGVTKDGVAIAAVGIASSAARAGLLRGDVIRAVDGKVIKSVTELNDLLTKKNGGPVQLFVQRKTQMGQVNLQALH